VTVHDSHSSFIKTPKQLVVTIVLAFVVPILGIVLIVQLVTHRPSADPNALTPESVAARIQPVARVEFGAPTAAPGARSGEAIVKTTCAACHQAGVANAPKIGDANSWAPRLKEGLKGMLANAIKGKGAMPPRGGDTSLTDDEVARAIVFMANQSGGKLKEPAAPKEAAKPAAPQQQAQAAPAEAKPAPAEAKPAPAPAKPAPDSKPAAESKPAAGSAEGKAVYEKVCFACHAQGLAGAPKLGDKEAWGPRVKQGMNTLVQSVTQGKGAMPPKAGSPSLTDAELRAGVEFMVSQSK
jgi:cytochrome c5